MHSRLECRFGVAGGYYPRKCSLRRFERDVANSSAAGVSASQVLEGVPNVRAGIPIPFGDRVLNQSKIVSMNMAWLISQVFSRAAV